MNREDGIQWIILDLNKEKKMECYRRKENHGGNKSTDLS